MVDFSHTATFAIDEASPRYRHCPFDDARRVWVNGKLFFSENKHDYLNYDNPGRFMGPLEIPKPFWIK